MGANPARQRAPGIESQRGDLVLRKAPEEWRGAAVAVSAVFGVPFVAAAAGALLAGEWLIALIAGSVVAAPAVAIGGHLRCSRIDVTAHEIAVRGFVVRRRVRRARAARVVRADLVQPRAAVVDTVFVLDAAGDLLVRVRGHHYRSTDIDRLVAGLGLPVTGPPGPVTAHQLATAHPGLVPWHEAHPLRLGLYVAAGAVLGVVVPAVVVGLLTAPT